MAETEHQGFGPRLARLLGVTSQAASDGVTTRLRPAIAMSDAAPVRDTWPEIQPLAGLAAEIGGHEAMQAAPPRDEGRRSSAPEDAPSEHMAAFEAVTEKRDCEGVRQPWSKSASPPKDEVQSLPKPEAEKIWPEVRQVGEQTPREAAASIAGPTPDTNGNSPAFSSREEVQLSHERPAAQPEPTEEPPPRRERIVVLAPESSTDAHGVVMEQPLPPTVPSAAPDEPGQEPSRAAPVEPGARDETQVAAAPPPSAMVVEPVKAPAPAAVPEPARTAAAPVPRPLVPEVTQSEQPKARPPEPPAPSPVKIEIGEVLISVRPPDVRTQRPTLSVVRRAPRAHTIPLSGFGED
jgi:hypothetical protein